VLPCTPAGGKVAAVPSGGRRIGARAARPDHLGRDPAQRAAAPL
jgi:hypothetical protein